MSSLIEIKGVSKTYGSGAASVHALRDIDLEVERGELLALCGPSGSGKSTLLNICGLLDRCDDGSYELDGQQVSRLGATTATDLRRERIGFIFQSFNLVPVMSLLENVEYPLWLQGAPAKQSKARSLELLERVGLADRWRHLPDQLSGGERQRAAVARALVKQPDLVIADEPTSSLDTATATGIVDLMREMAVESGTAFIAATHDSRMSERCDRVVTLSDGRRS